MSSSLETLLSNATYFKDLEPNLNNLTESDDVYFNVEEANLPHPKAFATKKTYMETNCLPSNFVPTFWSDTFAPHNKKHKITAALGRIVDRGVNDIEDFCLVLTEDNTHLLHEDIFLLQNKFGGQSCSATFSREQSASLVANMFYCTFPECKYRHKDLNAIRFFTRSNPVLKEKLKFMFSYFEQNLANPPTGCVSFVRKSVASKDFPNWTRAREPICKVAITSKLIEDLPNCLQVDFANKYIGGGVMNAGATQEEIRFLMAPEMFVSLLLCPVMEANEAIYINGTERYSDFTGYGNKLKWEPYDRKNNQEPRDELGRVLSNIVAIDANRYDVSKQNQYDKYWIDRELNKAYVAFESKNSPDRPIATGNWGCGVFGGDLQLKALIQILASSNAGRDVIYSPFTEKTFAKKLHLLVEVFKTKRITVGELYRILFDYRKEGRLDLFDFVKKSVNYRKQHFI